MRAVRLCFLTSTPLNIEQGSGTFTGIQTLATALRELGVSVELVHGDNTTSVETRARLSFNQSVAKRDWREYDATVGFDLDGFLLPRQSGPPHIACLKGVIADELRFEQGPARRDLRTLAVCERLNVLRAQRVIATSRYSASRIAEFYGRLRGIAILPEPIDLRRWQDSFRRASPAPSDGRFRVLCVCRFYSRKRLDLLLRAVSLLPPNLPLQLRLAGNGIESSRLRRLARELNLDRRVSFLGDVTHHTLASEYKNADLFVLASIQEGFGIVLLEAMCAGKPILATRTASIPEVAPHARFVDEATPEAIAHELQRAMANAAWREENGKEGLARVQQYDAPVVARQFLREISTDPVHPEVASSTAGESIATVQGVPG